MKSPHFGKISATICLSLLAVAARAQNFTVTPNGISAYVISAQQNPPLTFTRGVTYVFTLSGLGSHPFWIKSNSIASGNNSAYNIGVTSNGSTTGPVTFAVPTNAPNTLYYHCGNHSAMGAQINIVTLPSPPTVNVVFISVGNSNVVIKSTGATNWITVPEFKCATSATWTPVAGYTNTLANGTNTTTFSRLDAICGSNIFLRVRKQPN